jgi:hypothetical protein
MPEPCCSYPPLAGLDWGSQGLSPYLIPLFFGLVTFHHDYEVHLCCGLQFGVDQALVGVVCDVSPQGS